ATATPNWFGRNANSTGSNGTAANPDWIASAITHSGTAFNDFLLSGAATPAPINNTSLAGFGGRGLANIAGLNYFAGTASVQVNDGSAQRSQGTSLTVTFTAPVTLNPAQLPSIFQVLDASNQPLSLNFTLDDATGAAVTSVYITFATGSRDTYNLVNGFGQPDPISGLLSHVALNDGNYFLHIDGTQLTDALGQQVDAAGTGHFGSQAVDEFFRLFGDFDGNRSVDYFDQNAFRQGFGVGNPNYPANMFFDYDMNGVIDAADFAQF